MIKGWLHEIALGIQARSGATPGLFVWMGIGVLASLTAFVFLCVAAYDFLTLQLGNVYAALIMAGMFALIVIIAAIISAVSRRRARERAILERAARAHASSSWLLDPRLLSVAMQFGRTVGWQRLVPVALFGFLATQWAREYRQHKSEDSE